MARERSRSSVDILHRFCGTVIDPFPREIGEFEHGREHAILWMVRLDTRDLDLMPEGFPQKVHVCPWEKGHLRPGDDMVAVVLVTTWEVLVEVRHPKRLASESHVRSQPGSLLWQGLNTGGRPEGWTSEMKSEAEKALMAEAEMLARDAHRRTHHCSPPKYPWAPVDPNDSY